MDYFRNSKKNISIDLTSEEDQIHFDASGHMVPKPGTWTPKKRLKITNSPRFWHNA